MDQRTLTVAMLGILGVAAGTSVLIVVFYFSVVDIVNEANRRTIQAAVAMQNSDCQVWDLAGDTLYCKVRAIHVEGPVT